MAPLHQRLLAHNLSVIDVVAATNYSNGLNYALLQARGLTPWIPVFGQYKPKIEGFTYDKETDCFTCPAGKPLPFKRFDSDPDGRLSKRYSAATGDCRRCSRKPTCIPKSKSRKLTRTAYDTHYRRALARQQSRPGRRMRRLRQPPLAGLFWSLWRQLSRRQYPQ